MPRSRRSGSRNEPTGDAATELLTVRLRYKQPEGNESTGFDEPVADEVMPFEQSPADVRFAAAVASFGMLLRNSRYRGDATYEKVGRMAAAAKGDDSHGYRAEFVGLVGTAARSR